MGEQTVPYDKPLPALDHETLAPNDGWGAAEGVTGGSQAKPERIVEVRHRLELRSGCGRLP